MPRSRPLLPVTTEIQAGAVATTLPIATVASADTPLLFAAGDTSSDANAAYKPVLFKGFNAFMALCFVFTSVSIVPSISTTFNFGIQNAGTRRVDVCARDSPAFHRQLARSRTLVSFLNISRSILDDVGVDSVVAVLNVRGHVARRDLFDLPGLGLLLDWPARVARVGAVSLLSVWLAQPGRMDSRRHLVCGKFGAVAFSRISTRLALSLR